MPYFPEKSVVAAANVDGYGAFFDEHHTRSQRHGDNPGIFHWHLTTPSSLFVVKVRRSISCITRQPYLALAGYISLIYGFEEAGVVASCSGCKQDLQDPLTVEDPYGPQQLK